MTLSIDASRFLSDAAGRTLGAAHAWVVLQQHQ
jgi:hypothetical protein